MEYIKPISMEEFDKMDIEEKNEYIIHLDPLTDKLDLLKKIRERASILKNNIK